MKKVVFLLALAASTSATYGVAHARPAGAKTVALIARTYAEGRADGASYASSLAAQYGYGSQEYQEAIDAASARATFNARNSDEPTYWRGYNTGLAS